MKFLNNKKNILYLKSIWKLKKELPFFIYDLKSDLLKSQFNKNFFLKSLPSKILHQILFKLFVDKDEFGKKLAISYSKNSKFIYPLPLSWLKIVSKKLEVNYFLSTISFLYKVVINLIKDYIKNLLIIFSFKKNFNKDILYFSELPNNLSLLNEPAELNYFFKFKKIIDFKKKIIIHNNPNLKYFYYFDRQNLIKVKFCKNYLFINNNVFYKIWFFFYSTFLFLYSLCLIFFNKYYNALLYDDFIKVLFLKTKKDDLITFFFNNASGFHRPLWTYKKIFLNKNIESYFYFYSSNSATNKLTKKLELQKNKKNINIFYLLSWDNYLTCCEDQNEILRNNLDQYNYNFQNIGVISFQGNKKFFKKNSEKLTVSIFDVSAYRPRFVLYEQMPYNYYTLKNVSKFHEDIIDLFKKFDDKWKVVIKQKRPLDTAYGVRKKFSRLSVIENNKKIEKIADDVNTNSIILNSNLVISMPYTSPSFIAKEYGVKTVFYDPTGFLPEHILTKNISLISSKESLHNFIKNNF